MPLLDSVVVTPSFTVTVPTLPVVPCNSNPVDTLAVYVTFILSDEVVPYIGATFRFPAPFCIVPPFATVTVLVELSNKPAVKFRFVTDRF